MNNINKFIGFLEFVGFLEFLEFLGFLVFKLKRLQKLKKPNELCKLLLIFTLTAVAATAAAEPITKTSAETIPQYHEFYRTDGKGWLATGETIGDVAGDYTVKIYERDTGTEKTTDMISNVAVADGNATRSRVTWKIKAGTAGTMYLLKITINTSASHTFEDWAYLAVK